MVDFGFDMAIGSLSGIANPGPGVYTAGREGIGWTFLGHLPFHPFRPSASLDAGESLLEDLSKSYVYVSHFAQTGKEEAHGAPCGLDDMKRHFRYIYEQWLSKQSTHEKEGEDKVWVFGWLSHTNMPLFHAEIDSFLSWLNENFVNHYSEKGNLIARSVTARQVYNEYLKWEEDHPGQSSFSFKLPEFVYQAGEELDLSYTQADYTVIGADPDDEIGWWSVSAGGDVNGDGIADIILGALGADGPENKRSGCGEVYIIYGGNLTGVHDLYNKAPDYTIYGIDSSDQCGYSVAAADLNNDGFDDILIGALVASGPGNGRNGCGEVYVIYGGTLSGTQDLVKLPPDHTFYGAERFDGIGDSVSGNDVNGDGKADILIRATTAYGPGNKRISCGEVYLIYSDSLTKIWDLRTANPNFMAIGADSQDRFGCSVILKDVSNDGIADVMIGAPLGDGPNNLRSDCGEMHLIYSSSLSGVVDLLTDKTDFVVYCPDPIAKAGRIVVGDVNGDGKQDLVLGGAHGADGPSGMQRKDCGEVYVLYGDHFSGVRDLSTTPADFTIFGADSLDELGRFLSIGDVNGDHRADIVIGAYGGDGPENNRDSAGEVYIVYGGELNGNLDLLTNPADYTIYGADEGDNAGRFVFAADFSGDGKSDLLVSAN